MKLNRFKLIAALSVTFALAPAMAHEAHTHGIGKLDVAIEGATLSLHLDTPLANLVGFEHAARSDKDKKALRQMVAALNNAEALFVTTPAAECHVISTKLKSSVLDEMEAKSTRKKTGQPKNAHADMDADYAFNCTHPEQLNDIDVKLFSTFGRFHQIDVQVVTPKRQSSRKLLPNRSRISW